MNWFETVKRYHDLGFYSAENVKLFVDGGKLSEEEYKAITGVDYKG